MIKRILLVIAVSLITKISYSQSLSIESSTGGFAFIPSFASTDPHFILNANTNLEHRLSGHLISNIRMENGLPRNLILIGRYKLVDQKLKVILGFHLPAFQIKDDYTVNSFIAQEITTSYSISEAVIIGTYFLHGEGRNFDFNGNLLSFNSSLNSGNFNFLTQFYLVNIDNTKGVAQTIAYKLNDKFSLKAFATKIVTSGDFKWTLGLKYNL